MRSAALLAWAALAVGCSRSGASPAKDDKRIDLTVWLDPKGDVGPDGLVLSIADPLPPLQFVERAGLKLAVIGVPREGDPMELMERTIADVHHANVQAAFFVTTRCLSDLQPTMRRNLLPFWIVALVVGARCDGGFDPEMGAAAQVAIGSASRVRITFDRSTRVFLRVEPLP